MYSPLCKVYLKFGMTTMNLSSLRTDVGKYHFASLIKDSPQGCAHGNICAIKRE
jgi:hypothetical protein